MKKWIILITIILFFTNSVFSTLEKIDKIVAIVNNDIILESDLNNNVFIKNNNNLTTKLLKEKILKKLIIDTIILQKAKEANINSKELDNLFSDKKLFKNISKQMNISYDSSLIKKKIIIQNLINSVVSRKINIFPQEIEDFVRKKLLTNKKKFKLDHIKIPFPDNPSLKQINQAKILAIKLKSKIKLKKSFNTNNKKIIVYKNWKKNWKKLEELPSLFTNNLKKAKKGDIIGPIHSDSGFHILKIIDICDTHSITTKIHARHILLRPSIIQSDGQAYTKLVNIVKKIKNGKLDFSTVAKNLSEDYYTSLQGGDLGWNYIEVFDPFFQKILKKLKKNEISTPIKSKYGWHIVQLIDSCKVENTNVINNNYAYNIIYYKKFIKEKKNFIKKLLYYSKIKIL